MRSRVRTWEESPMMESILITLSIFSSGLGYGRLVLGKWFRGHLLIRLGVGLWIIAHLVLLLGVTSLLYRVCLLLVLLPGIAFFLFWIFQIHTEGGLAERIKQTLPRGWLEWSMVIPPLCLVVLAMGGALTPPTARDSLVYHLALPKLYLESHQWVEVPQNVYGYFPGLMEALYTIALGLGSPYPALVHAGFGIACLAATFFLGGVLGLRREICLLSVCALAATATLWAEMTWAYVDLANAFYWTLVVLCFLRWQNDRQRRWLLLLGFFMGAANGCKYTSLILLMVVPLGLLIELRKSTYQGWNKTISTVAVPLVTALVLALPWWARNLVLTGNPVYPFFWGLFPSSSPGWDAERAGLYQIMLAQYGGAHKGILDYVVAPVRVFLAARFDSVSRYDGELNAFCLLAWLLLLVRREKRGRPGEILLGLSLVYLAYWSSTSQQARFLLPILPVMAVLGGFFVQIFLAGVAERITTPVITRRRIENLAVSCILVATLFNGRGIVALWHRGRYLDHLLGRESTDRYLLERLPYYGMYRYINRELPKHAVLLMVKTGNRGYYLERSYFSDAVFEAYTFTGILANSDSAAEVARTCHQRGWTHLLIRLRSFLEEQGPLMPRADLERFGAFLRGYCLLLKKDRGFWLFMIENVPVAAEKPGQME